MTRVTAILATAAALAILSEGVAAAPTLQCKTALETGVAPAQPSVALGTPLAREAWRLIVLGKFGPAWSEPLLAQNKFQNCVPQPTGLGGTVFVCLYRARPCKL